jgi:hypothetical protein
MQTVRLSELHQLGLKPANFDKILGMIEKREPKEVRENLKKLGIEGILKNELGFPEAKERVVVDNEVVDYFIPEE